MSSRHALRTNIAASSTSAIHAPPVFLAPLLAGCNASASRGPHFSTSSPLLKRRKLQKRDSNPDRGVSALRRTGLRHPVSMAKYPLPQPVLDPEKHPKPTVSENHGLWGFFNEKRTTLSTPEEDNQHGMLGKSLFRSSFLTNAPKADRGRLKNCGISPSKIYTRSGGNAAKNGISLPHKGKSGKEWAI